MSKDGESLFNERIVRTRTGSGELIKSVMR